MVNHLDKLSAQWKEALANNDNRLVERLVKEVLQEHPNSVLACEIHYHRGTLTLTSGEGIGSERLARALSEFRSGASVGEHLGDIGEPWRSLNQTQMGGCYGRLGNLQKAKEALSKVATYKPYSSMGIGALLLLSELLQRHDSSEARRIDVQRLRYVEVLVRESEQSADANYFRFLLAQEMLKNNQKQKAIELLMSLKSGGKEELGDELFEDVLRQIDEMDHL